MKISIITATLNRGNTISRALKSIKSQSHPNIQLVVIDGGSDDNSVELVKPFLGGDDVFISEPDDGIYDALNKEVLKWQMERLLAFSILMIYFLMIMSFQWWLTHSLITLLMWFMAMLVFFSVNNPMDVRRRYRSSKLTLKNLAWGKMPAHPSIFIRRNIYSEIGYFKTNFRIAADYEFLCRLAKYPNLKSIYLPCPFVRMQLGGISTLGFSNTIILNKEVLRALRNNDIYSNIFYVVIKIPIKNSGIFLKMKVLVTGASGFVGTSLVNHLTKKSEISVVAMVRSIHTIPKNMNAEYRIAEICSNGEIDINLNDIDVVIHTAGRAHVMNEKLSSSTDEYRRVNTKGTISLARLSVKSGVKKFIFLSSIKVNGDRNVNNEPFFSK